MQSDTDAASKDAMSAASPAADRELAIAIRDGDVASFAVLFREYYPVLVRALARYGATVDAGEDIAQDVFLQLWERRVEIDPDRSVRGYLFMLGRNRVLNVLAHDTVKRRHVEHELAQYPNPTDQPTAPAADQATLLNELTDAVAVRVARLSPRQKEIYHLSRDEGLTANEIGQILDIAPQTVYVQLGRIFRALYPLLERWLTDGT